MVIATVFLTIIGMAAGYVLGERHRRNDSAGSGPAQASGTTNVVTSAPSTTVPVDGPLCPDPAQQAAAVVGGVDLRQIFMIVTKNKSTVWICEDNLGKLYYQSHTLFKGQDLPLVQNKNGLFLPGVTRDGDGFKAYDQYQNRFEIGREKFQIYFAKGTVQSDDVTKVEG